MGADGRILTALGEDKLWYMMFRLHTAERAKDSRPGLHKTAWNYVNKQYNNEVINGRWGSQYLLTSE